MRYLIDSNILIYHLNGEAIATDFLAQHLGKIAISQITYLEVLSFDFTKDEARAVTTLLESFDVLDVDIQVTRQAVRNRHLKKIKVPII